MAAGVPPPLRAAYDRGSRPARLAPRRPAAPSNGAGPDLEGATPPPWPPGRGAASAGRSDMSDIGLAVDALESARARTLRLTDCDERELTAQHSALMSPLVWDLAHVGQQEEYWLLQV